jgi:hypothetical protein
VKLRSGVGLRIALRPPRPSQVHVHFGILNQIPTSLFTGSINFAGSISATVVKNSDGPPAQL